MSTAITTQKRTRKYNPTEAAPFPAIIDKQGHAHPDLTTIPARIDKHGAAAFVTRFFYPCSYRTIERLPVKWVRVNGRRTWAPADLAAYCRQRVSSAPPGWGTPASN